MEAREYSGNFNDSLNYDVYFRQNGWKIMLRAPCLMALINTRFGVSSEFNLIKLSMVSFCVAEAIENYVRESLSTSKNCEEEMRHSNVVTRDSTFITQKTSFVNL